MELFVLNISMPEKCQIKSPQKLWENISSLVVSFVEKVFFSLGVSVAKHPWKVIIVTWIFVLLSCVGMLKFHIEKNPMKLWVPPDSDFYYDTHWYIDKFGTGFRFQKILITGNDVLNSNVLVQLYNLTQTVESIEIKYSNKTYSLENLCFKVPIVNNIIRKSRSVTDVSMYNKDNNTKDNNTDFLSPFIIFRDLFSDQSYCEFLESFPMTCLRYNLLDLWDSDLNVLQNLTKHDIVSKINQVKINPATGHPTDFIKLLGGVERDENGNIVNAKALLFEWYTAVNMIEVDLNEVGNLVGTEDWVSPPLLLWEGKFLEVIESISHNTSLFKVYYEAGRSFGDISGQAMFSELDKLILGIILMFIYIQIALSKCNWLEIKLTLASIGLLSVGMAYVTAVSWCSLFGVAFGPVHSSLPFLLMGLGVDDMFVMNACWKNLSSQESKKSLSLKMGLMLKHAGVSIVITSFTDIVALLIGSITILPSLKSFCIYAAVGVFFIFCYSVTFYVAVFTLDIKRIEAKRNGIFFCYEHKNEIKISQKTSVGHRLFLSFFKKIVFSVPGKIVVILFTCIITGFSIESLLKLEQKFDPRWFIPKGTYYKDFLGVYEYYYPSEGEKGIMFFGEMDYNYEFQNLVNLVFNLKKEPYIDYVDGWVDSFSNYSLKVHNKYPFNLTDNQFKLYLSEFLFSADGGRFQNSFSFTHPASCGQPVPNITASSMVFKFKKFNGSGEYIPAMNNIKRFVKSANISTGDGYRSVWAKIFANWVTDEVIAVEVERNVELALLCVMVCTVILITNLQMCFWIFLCVLLTIVNVLGWMQKWGMTIDIVCCIGLELAIGLCVDYAAHVGHTFLTMKGESRSERAMNTVTSIGCAVLLGGGSTFLSLSILSVSKAYTFQSFFKIFFLVIIFGLFNGLLFLPVILSLIGPNAYIIKEEKDSSPDTIHLNGHTDKPLQLNGLVDSQEFDTKQNVEEVPVLSY